METTKNNSVDKKTLLIIALLLLAAATLWLAKPEYQSNLSQPINIQEVATEAPVDLYQGIEAHLDAIVWNGHTFNAGQDNGITSIGGINDFKTNKIIFNPDAPTRGLPSLVVTAGVPQPLQLGSFINETLGTYTFAPSIARLLDTRKPYETYRWMVINKDNKRQQVQMDAWLEEFKVVIEAKPSAETELDAAWQDKVSPLTGKKNASLPNEYSNQRYGNLDIVLKLTGNTPPLVIAADGAPAQALANPHFAIAALEVASVKFLGDKERKVGDIGAYLEKGESLTLYDKLATAQMNAYGQYVTTSDLAMRAQVRDQVKQKDLDGVVWSQTSFDKDKYAYIHLANFGSWKEWHLWRDNELNADKIEVRFVMHVFSIGSWELQRPVVTGQLDPTPSKTVHEHSWLAGLLPDFHFSWPGKGLLTLAGLLVLAVLFPPLFSILNSLLAIIAAILHQLAALFRRPKS